MSKYHVVAKAVRLEYVKNKDDVFIVFKIIDEDFKQRVTKSFMDDIELEIKGKNLIIKE